MAYNFGSSLGNLNLLSSQTASGASNLDFTSVITTAYDDLVLIFSGVVGSAATADLSIQFSTDNGGSWINTNYVTDLIIVGSGGATISSTGSLTSSVICQTVENVAGSQSGGLVNFLNITAGTVFPVFTCFPFASGSVNTSGYIGGANIATIAVNAIRVLISSGTFSGSFKLYGVEK